MFSYKKASVMSVEKNTKKTQILNVKVEDEVRKAVNYKSFIGEVKVGDELIINTTAVDLSLGTGGFDFVILNLNNLNQNLQGEGHIMKLRYTPYQIKCLTAEEQDSEYHNVFKEFKSLDNHIFIVATLHSMLAPIAAMIKYKNPHLKINYIMTDGGSLPIDFSDTVLDLKEKNIINKTITIGHAFGGDLETINIYNGLIAAKEILKGDVTIISMGPGIVGSGTKYGFTGIEQGYIIDAINNLGGKPIVVPRISFKDNRDRHFGISHHTITTLSKATNTEGNVILPSLEESKDNHIKNQLRELGNKHNFIFDSGEDIVDAMDHFGLKTTSMGRTINDDVDYFISLGAVGNYVSSLFLKEEKQ